MVTLSKAWSPRRSLRACEEIITAPGRVHELEHTIIDGRVLRVYKNLPSNLRTFWLTQVETWTSREYVVFENDRYTYIQIHERASRLASLLYTKYAVRKGDRIAILMRNFPEFVVAFWAIHLLGGVATLVNAWAASEPLQHCITVTNPKVIITDPERADRLSGRILEELKQKTSLNGILIARAFEAPSPSRKHSVSSSRWRWKGMSSLEDAIASYDGPPDAWRATAEASPEDNATIFFTSGTTGLPKGVLSSQRQFLTNFFNAHIARLRSILRKGEDFPEPDPDEPQRAVLLSVPLFHATGCTSILLTCTGGGGKLVLIRKWDVDEAVKLIVKERVTSAGGVPSMVMDLIESSLRESALESLSCGGAPSSDTMPNEVRRKFKNVEAGQGYGLSETNAIATSIHGEDFIARPASCGLASPVNDLIVVDPATQKVLGTGQVGELWIKGANVMKGYWADPAATDKAITRDGWFKSGDLGCIDDEGFVYIKDRVKDIIIRGGENIHSVEVENALYADERLIDAAAVSVPDRRLGELVAAVVTTKPQYRGQVAEEEVIAITKKILPAYAVPVMVLVQDEQIERNANGKIMKDSVRKRVRKEYARRQKQENAATAEGSRAKL